MPRVIHEEDLVVGIDRARRVTAVMDEASFKCLDDVLRDGDVIRVIAGVKMGDPGARLGEADLFLRHAKLRKGVTKVPTHRCRRTDCLVMVTILRYGTAI